MGIMDFIRKQFIDVIEMPELDSELLVKKFKMEDQEIQYGATLVVRESQLAIFVNEGKFADVFGPGTYTLSTQTIPVLTNLKNWDKFFQSPFKSDVYFLNARLQMGGSWGTPQAITIRDKEFGMVQVRAFGNYHYKITSPKEFFANISGASDNFTSESLESQLRSVVMSSFSSFVANSGIPFIDMAANQHQLAQKIKESLIPTFQNYGLALTDFIIQSFNLPEEVQKTVNAKISMGVVGDLDQYTKFQAANSISLAAQNEGGLGAMGASLGLGAAMAQAVAGSLNQGGQNKQENKQEDLEAKLTKAKSMLDKGLISQEEYNKIKSDVLSRF